MPLPNNPDTKKSSAPFTKSDLPNADIVSSFFESYLNIRKGRWQIGEGEPIQLINSDNTAHKIKTCIELLEAFQKAKTFDDWIDVLYLCTDKENLEKKHNTDSWLYSLTKFFSDKPILLSTIHAANAYILSQLMQHNEFSLLKQKLTAQKILLDNSIKDAINYHTDQSIIDEKQTELKTINKKLSALEMPGNYHRDYFLDIIRKREPKAIELGEESFADYEKDVLEGQRPLSMCKMLLGYNESTRKQLTNAANSVKSSAADKNKPSDKPIENRPTEAKPAVSSGEPDTKRDNNHKSHAGLTLYTALADIAKRDGESPHNHYNLRRR